MDIRDIRRDVLLGAVHHCHRGGGQVVILEGVREEWAREGLEMESVEGGCLVLYTIRSSRGLS